MIHRLCTCAETRQNPAGKVFRALLLMSTLMLVMIALPVDAGKIYKWVDDQGKVHYGSEKPADEPAERVHVNTEKTGAVPGRKALAEEQKKQEAEAKAIKEKGIPAQPPVPALSRKEIGQRCQQARNDLANIEAHGRMRVRDEKGNINYASDEARQKRIAAAKKAIREYCH
jgi:uncharacterized protein YyaL (SSP411 family)